MGLSELEKRTLRVVTSVPLGRLEFEEKAALRRYARLGLLLAVGLRNGETATLTDAGRKALKEGA